MTYIQLLNNWNRLTWLRLKSFLLGFPTVSYKRNMSNEVETAWSNYSFYTAHMFHIFLDLNFFLFFFKCFWWIKYGWHYGNFLYFRSMNFKKGKQIYILDVLYKNSASPKLVLFMKTKFWNCHTTYLYSTHSDIKVQYNKTYMYTSHHDITLCWRNG